MRLSDRWPPKRIIYATNTLLLSVTFLMAVFIVAGILSEGFSFSVLKHAGYLLGLAVTLIVVTVILITAFFWILGRTAKVVNWWAYDRNSQDRM